MAEIVDTMILGVPRELEVEVQGVVVVARMSTLFKWLSDVTTATVAHMYPRFVRLIDQQWTLARSPEQAEAWPLPHDCDSCLDGRVRAVEHLRLHPGSTIALGRIVWEERAIPGVPDGPSEVASKTVRSVEELLDE